jgi:2-desacetyl-2-hydroxyethyl bacteriochlorophyllide A dehydrogenase
MIHAVEVTSDHQINVKEVERPLLGPTDVLIAPAACGICGTDRHIAEGDFPGSNYPVVPGHEFSGYVVASGADAAGFADGAFVAVDPNVVCGQCRWCRSGRPNLCESLVPIGVGRPGAAAELVVVPRQNVYGVSTSLSPSAAALIEPLACVLNALDAGGDVRDRSVLITGAGTMGLLIAIVAAPRGAHVTVADPSPFKLDVARQLGADAVILPQRLERESYDVIFEASGSPSAVRQALTHLAKRGRLVQVGVLGTTQTVEIRPFDIYERELSIVGSNSLPYNFEAAADVMVDIAELATRLITHRFPVWDYGLAIASTAQPEAIKTHLTFS